jgi:parallel beta-helix repeat protein
MVTPTDGMVITADTTLAPGIYHLPRGLSIAADGVTLDGGGALLVGAGEGRGLSVRGRGNVTVKNLRLSHYYHGIFAEDCAGLTIAGCQARATAEVQANTVFLDIWRPAEQAYGGGVMLLNVRDSLLAQNDLQHQQNGLLCYGCARLRISDNIASSCSGFGFHLFDTSDCLVERNCADYCCRYEPRGNGRGHLGADAAGFLIAHGSCRNIFRENLARMGGDGFFLAGLRPDWAHVPCDDNLFEGNDGSHSPNIAFEATFSSGNVFRRNRASACNYGFWLGFSSRNLVEGNEVRASRQAGVAVENGVGCVVRNNEFAEGAYGVLLWSKHVAPFAAALPGNDTSRDWLIEGNRFLGNSVGVRIAADQDHGVRPLPAHVPRCPRPAAHALRHNQFRENRLDIELIGAEDPLLEANDFEE